MLSNFVSIIQQLCTLLRLCSTTPSNSDRDPQHVARRAVVSYRMAVAGESEQQAEEAFDAAVESELRQRRRDVRNRRRSLDSAPPTSPHAEPVADEADSSSSSSDDDVRLRCIGP